MSKSALSLLGVALCFAVIVLIVTAISYQHARSEIAADHSPGVAPIAGSLPALPVAWVDDEKTPGARVRVAVIGGMVETGFWNSLAHRYFDQTGTHITLIASGPKGLIEHAFKANDSADLITMHASDTIINLVADGYCLDAQPWMRNDQIIVGPPSDPAGIRGMTDAAAALAKIATAHAPFVVHASLGTQEVLHQLLDDNDIHLDEKQITLLFADNRRNVLHIASEKNAYTLVGRIPFRDGKLPNENLIAMVTGDPRLRRPFMVAVANPQRLPHAHYHDAQKLAAWMRSPDTQKWIATYGRGQLDDQPLFFPVEVPMLPTTTTRP